jgi:xylan 1,4-beta-xylosidase
MTPLSFLAAGALALAGSGATWTADHGNGAFSNPLFYDEFPDPDLIRVGDHFYLTGTTMHAMPGLPILRSTDLVNWELVG